MAIEKKVDESWKKKVEEEKERAAREGPKTEPSLPPASFFTHVTSIATQVMISLGEVEHPGTGKRERKLPEARFGIDTLQVLEEKTKGNLTDDETQYLQSVLTELRMKYVSASQDSPVKP